MDEKQRVLSKLRALLLSSGRKDGIPLRELIHEYCVLECTHEIPYFNHKGVIDFLTNSGEFAVSVETTGLVTVREKPKSLTSHLKRLTAAEQKTRSTTGSTVVKAVKNLLCKNQKQEPPSVREIEMTQWNASAKNHSSRLAANMNIEVDPTRNVPEHTKKPSTVFTFSQLKEQRNTFVTAQKEADQPSETKISSIKANGETMTRNRKKTTDIGDNADRSSQGNLATYEDSFNKLNRMCVNFSKSLICDVKNKYWAVLQIDQVQYFGEGNTSDEANDNAASKYLHSVDTGVHRKRANQEYAHDVAPNLSIIKLHEMYDELNYRTVVRLGEHNMFKTAVQVDSVNYYGHGKSFQQAAANAADACLQSIKQGLHNKIANSTADLSRCK